MDQCSTKPGRSPPEGKLTGIGDSELQRHCDALSVGNVSIFREVEDESEMDV